MYNLSNLEPNFKKFLHAENISSISLRNYLSDLRHFLGWTVSKYSIKSQNQSELIESITPKIIDQYKQEHINLRLPTKTINRRLSSIRKFFDFCNKSGLITQNPVKSLKNISVAKPRSAIKNIPLKSIIKTSSFVNFKLLGLPESTSFSIVHRFKSFVIFLFLILSFFFLVKISSSINVSNFLLNSNAKDLKTRYILFKGNITDILGNPLTSKTDVIFRFYNSEQGGNTIYTVYCVGTNALTPDVNGSINTTLGSDCGGIGIPNSIFLENPEVYLGISVNNDQEMYPREKIANVGYAMNSETIQGFPLGNSASSVPFIDSSGSLLISAPSPAIKSSNGTFTINGQSIVINTSSEKGDISLSPGGNILVTSGNLGIGTDQPSAKLDVEGSASISGNLVFRNIETQINQLNGGNIIFQTSVDGIDQLTPKVTLTNRGNLGIGTLFPLAKLDVSGGGRFYDSTPLIGTTTLSIRAGADQGSNSLFQWQDSSGNSLGLIDANGKLGVGTTNVQWRLQATDNQPYGSVAMIENTGANNTFGHTGLQIKLGTYNNTNPDENDRFISFLRGDSTLVGKIQGNSSGGITYSTSGSDFAEYFNTYSGLTFNDGDVVSLNSETGKAEKNNQTYNPQTLGVVSSHPGFTGGEPGNNKVLVSLLGQVPVKIYSRSSSINPGDFLTTSYQPGYAMKAEKAGIIIGKALETWVQNQPKPTILVMVDVGWYDPSVYLSRNGDAETLNKDAIYNGNLQDGSQLPLIDILNNQLSNIINNTLITKNLIAEKISTVTSNIEHLTSNIINVNEKITSPVIETTDITSTGEAKLNNVTANEIKPQGQNLTINLNTRQQPATNVGPLAKLIITGLAGKTVATVDSAGDASFSGQLAAPSIVTGQLSAGSATISGILAANNASVSGTLIAKEVKAENINSLNQEVTKTQTNLNSQTSNIEHLTSNINDIQKLISNIKNQPLPDPQYYQDLNGQSNTMSLHKGIIEQLTVTGNSNLYSITANSSTIGTLLFQNNSILSLSWQLRLSSLSTINLFDDTVIISKEGNITTKGYLLAEKGIKTDNIEPLNDSGNVNIQRLATNNLTINNKYMEATSSSAIITAADNFEKNGLFAPAIETKTESAGIGTIPNNSDEIIIYNQNIEENSLIYLTATSSTPVSGLTVSDKVPCNNQQSAINNCKPYFKVALDKDATSPVQFNWLIIN